ncbi:Zinc finger BED domain-containing protein RICESLEEPER 2 [Bienertia sinuspersici]
METFHTFDGHVILTNDTWTSKFGEPFVDDEWLLQICIYFVAMEEVHNGYNIKTRIINCCKIIHLLDKILSLSLDNATANTRAIEFSKEDPSLSLLLNGSLLYIRCCAHILNLFCLRSLDSPAHWNSTYNWLMMLSNTKRSCQKYTMNLPNIHHVILKCIKLLNSFYQTTEDDFHIIKWWKNHSTKFLILARIANNIFAIPTSTIASNSKFSVGRRVLYEKRSCLAPQSIDMCVCKKI